MIRPKFILLPLALSLAATLIPAVSARADSTEAPQAASLTITPDKEYVGGQGLRWTGNIGVLGVRPITMQKFLGRAGDEWTEVEYFTSQTDAAGNFAYWYGAPSMRSIRYRVASGTLVTPDVELWSVQPELILWVTGGDPEDPQDIGDAVATEPFGISVDTTPDLYRRPDTDGLQPIPGRGLTLQRRVEGKGEDWVTLDSTVVDDVGMGYFTGVTEEQPGEVVYRVREENWKQGHDDIGWYPSFPTYVRISALGVESGPAMVAPTASSGVQDEAEVVRTDEGGTASQTYGWPASLYDFAWVLGESLTSRPWRGQEKKGWWLDHSDGGGRVSKDGGGLLLDSKRENRVGAGDFGTAKATLQDHPIKFGRWETKLNVTTEESDGRDYQVRLELVPDRAQSAGCRTITVAEFTAQGNSVSFGVNATTNQWTGSTVLGPMEDRTASYAIEVARDHITWFIDAEPVGTVARRKAIPRVPMTMRMSILGDGDREMNRTELKSDWQRGFTLDKGEQVKNGPSLNRRDLADCR